MESERRWGKKKGSVHHGKPPTSKPAFTIGFISKHGFCNLHNCEGNLNAEQKAFRAEQTHPSNVFVIEVPSWFKLDDIKPYNACISTNNTRKYTKGGPELVSTWNLM